MPFDPLVSRDADLRVWRQQFRDATPVHRVELRRQQTCVGVVDKIRLVPGRQLEVTISDGTGHLTAIFTGRSNLPGLELGGGLRVTGTVGQGGDGELQIRNPAWTTVSEPYA